MGLHALLVSWKEKKYIANSIYRSLLSNDGILPRATLFQRYISRTASFI